MMRKNNDRKNTMLHQPTLVGLWQGEEDNGDNPATSREKKRTRVSSIETFPQNIAPPLPSPKWENISLPNGPMYLLRGCIGGKNSLERRLTRESLASLPDWNENVKFKIFGKHCQMRRVSVSITTTAASKFLGYLSLLIDHQTAYLSVLVRREGFIFIQRTGK